MFKLSLVISCILISSFNCINPVSSQPKPLDFKKASADLLEDDRRRLVNGAGNEKYVGQQKILYDVFFDLL